jgi:hypothetical protein
MRALAGGMALLGAVALADAASVRPALAVSGAAYCAAGAGRQAAVPVPRELEPLVAKAFDISVDMARAAASVRCVGDKLMACWVGANLNCGKANASRSLPGASAYCRDHPGSAFIPMSATGHDTIYDWRCVGGRAVAGKTNLTVDALGYVADNWKEVP